MTTIDEHVEGEVAPCLYCEIADRLKAKAEALGDVVHTAIEHLEVADIQWSIPLLPAATLVGMMRALNLAPLRTPTTLFAQQVIARLQRQPTEEQAQSSWHLSLTVMRQFPMNAKTISDVPAAVDRLLFSVPPGIGRLAIARLWSNRSRYSPYLLRALLVDERVAVPEWSKVSETLISDCDEAIRELEDRQGLISNDGDIDQMNAAFSDESGDEASDLVHQAHLAMEVATAALPGIEQALYEGSAPAEESMILLTAASSALNVAGEILELPVPPPLSLGRLDEALAAQLAMRQSSEDDASARIALRKLARASSNSSSDIPLGILSNEASDLAAREDWSEDERIRISILCDLVDAVEAASRDDEETLSTLSERLAAFVDARVMVAVARGRVALRERDDDLSVSIVDEPANDPEVEESSAERLLLDQREEEVPTVSESLESSTDPVVVETENAPPFVAEEMTSTEELKDLVAACVGERRFGIAAWLIEASDGNKGFVEALRVAALADAVRTPNGAVVSELDERSSRLSIEMLDGDRAGRVLVLIAALRVSLLHPQGVLTGIIGGLADGIGSVPGLQPIVVAIARATQRGLSLTADLLPTAQNVAAVEERVRVASEAASAELSQPRTTYFARGTKILSTWVSPEGLITKFLEPVGRNDHEQRSSIESEVRRLRDHREVEYEVDRLDRELRAPGARRIEGQVRLALVNRMDHALDAAAEWLDAVTLLEASRPELGRWQDVPLRELRAAVSPERERALASLRALSSDPIASSVGVASASMLQGLFELLDGNALPGAERTPFQVLDEELLKSHASTADLFSKAHFDVSLSAAMEAARRNWREGFDARCASNEFDAALAIVECVAMDDPGTAESMREEYELLLAASTNRISTKRRPLVDQVNDARRSGFLDEEMWGSLSVSLSEADPDSRNDLGECDDILERVALSLVATRIREQAAFDAEFEQRRAEVAAVEAQSDVIERLAASGDLATARDFMARAEAGDEALTITPTGEHISAFFPRFPDELVAGLSSVDLEILETGGRVADTDLSGLSAGELEVALNGLRTWTELKAKGNSRVGAVTLAPALRILGIEADGEASSSVSGGSDRRWLDLVGVRRTGKALVPAFGSGSGTRLRLLCCWSSPDPLTLLALVAQDPSERSVVVLYFGTLSSVQRCAFATELRSNAGSSRAVIVVDDAVMFYLAAHGARRYDTLMQVTLPFTDVNPYEPDVAGAVPTEMFYGRLDERRSVMDPRGTSLIYGGRQLGKSALLHAAERRFEETPHQVAVYVDLRGAAIGATKRSDAVWDPVVDALVVKCKPERRPARKDPAAVAEELVRAFLAANPERRILLLLDECDDFFDVDAEARFVNISRLRELMDSTDRRFKVVFAGLHQVQRFAAIPNQPLAHLGRPQVIGPLSPQPAFDLLHGPLEALGYEIGDDVAARLMANANYQPLALQLYGQALIKVLRRRPMPNLLPSQVLVEDLEAVLGDEALGHQVRQRFELTLRLDPRYRVIAYAVAYRSQIAGNENPVSTEVLRRECIEWWADGFAQLRPDDFRGLVEEMVGLGVLASVLDGWRLRSPNVMRMLGTTVQIEDALIEAGSETPPAGFAAAEMRRVIDSSAQVRSPLSEAQLAELLSPKDDQLLIVLGSQACGVDEVGNAIKAAALARPIDVSEPRTKSAFKTHLRKGKSGDHIVVVSILDSASDAISTSVELALTTETAEGVARTVVLVVPCENLDWWPHPFSLDSERISVVELRRHSARSLWAWAVDVPGAFQDERSRNELLKATGGWPFLVDQAAEFASEMVTHGGAREEIASRLQDHLTTAEGAEELVDAVGLRNDAAMTRLYDAILTLGGLSESREDLALLADDDFEDPAAAIEALCALGVLDVESDGRLCPEPVFRRAWERVQPL